MTSSVRRFFERVIPIHKEERLREWASDNAYTLLFIAAMFAVTWILILLDIFVGVTR